MLESTQLSGSHSGSFQRADHVGQLHPEPGEKTFAQAVNFSVARRRRERNGIEIVDNDSFSPRSSIPPSPVSVEACANKLAVFFNGRFGAPIGRMAKFFQFYGHTAASLYLHFEENLGTRIEHRALK